MLDKTRMPRHVAVIMDGNGRWAKQRKLPRVAGHNAGMKSMKEIVRRSSDLGIEHLTVYAFSTENWKRSVEEISGIFRLLVIYIDKDLRELHRNNVRIKILGDYSKIPADARARLEKALELTKLNTGLQFNIALNYGGREEILRAVKAIAAGVQEGLTAPEDIDYDMISSQLYTGMYDIPDPDVVIRTSGEERLSNFLLWQAAYSEFVFSGLISRRRNTKNVSRNFREETDVLEVDDYENESSCRVGNAAAASGNIFRWLDFMGLLPCNRNNGDLRILQRLQSDGHTSQPSDRHRRRGASVHYKSGGLRRASGRAS